ncbi:hypothetical protein ESCO_002621 [Escovopsis weberi]|uniref:Uncharacterized protein n=1 Tax=Escovopsis weberi TaxID=150374 RepID=A0A0M8N0M6_ESCWE|nr:hypothetical protein ESCO_002621 [Escovopsis weberi]
MAPAKRQGKQKPKSSSSSASSGQDGSPPAPFKQPPDVLAPFIERLDEKHVYITHIDSKPASFKRKIFLVPVAMNVAVVIAFVWRMRAIFPWYWRLAMTGFGEVNELSFTPSESTWAELLWVIWTRGMVMFIDLMLFIFVWPWPVEFAFGRTRGNPMLWRWSVGFRDKEIYVRRSRDWDRELKDIFRDPGSGKILLGLVRQATSPILQEQKTGYLLMDGKWDLDWQGMVDAHAMVTRKEVALEAFKNVVLVFHQDHGWLCCDLRGGGSAVEDEKRRQVFAFRDALTALGKENLFYRWVEIVQYESTQPGGFGPEKQEAAAKKIRELFEEHKVDFDDLWKETMEQDT